MNAHAGKVSISEVSRLYAKDRKAVYELIERKCISIEKTIKPKRTLIQLADIIQHWGEPTKTPTPPTREHEGSPRGITPNPTPYFSQQVSDLKEQINELREDKEQLRKDLKEERESRNELEKQITEIIKQQTTLMLEDKRTQPPKNSIPPQVLWVFLPVCAIITAMPVVAWFLLNFLKP